MAIGEQELRIDPTEAKARVDAGAAIIVDVVAPAALAAVTDSVQGAIRIPPDELTDRYSELPRDRDIIAYCT